MYKRFGRLIGDSTFPIDMNNISLLALWQKDDVSRVYPTSQPVAAGTGSSCPVILNKTGVQN